MKQNKAFPLSVLMVLCFLFIQGCKDDDDDNETPQQPIENVSMDPCDQTLSLVESDAVKAAQAIDLCKLSSGGSDWGLVSATYIRASDVVLPINSQYGIMSSFGSNNTPRKGQNLLVMSTGRARTPSQPNSCGSSACNGTGAGTPSATIPSDVPGCTPSNNIYDDIGIKLVVQVPASAKGFSIDHSFFTFDYPEWLCGSYNDQFIILVDPAPSGSVNGQVAFDSLSVPVGVNSSFIQGSNTALLTGTGFDVWDDAASTGWLRTTIPVTGGTTITIRLLIYDVGDGASDSSVLLDNFVWHQNTVSLKTSKL